MRNVNFKEMHWSRRIFSLPHFLASNSRDYWFWFCIILGSLSLAVFLNAAAVSKFLPPSKSVFIHAIQNDWYYCFLVPLTLLILLVAVYSHWLSMKFFKHA